MNTETMENSLGQVTDTIREGIQSGAYTWKELQQAMMEKTRETARQTDLYVHEHPWKIIGLAAALGLVVGLLLRSGNSEEETV